MIGSIHSYLCGRGQARDHAERARESALVQPFDRSRWLSVYPPSVVDDDQRRRDYAHDTQVATQMMREAGEADASADIGRAVGNGVRELFVTTDAAEALKQQFMHLAVEYVAVHDVAINTSRKLLGGVAAASGRSVQRLLIRRQGYGTTLASIDFVDCPRESGQGFVRLFSTDADADSATRQSLARVLLAHSTMAVVMVGDLPSHAQQEQIAPLRQQFLAGGWLCQYLQFMPLFALPTLAGHVEQLVAGTGIQASVTAQVKRPADAWDYLSVAWNQLQGELHPDGNAARVARLTGGGAAAAPVARPAAMPGGTVNIGMPTAVPANPVAAAAVLGPAAAVAPPAAHEGLLRLAQGIGGLAGVAGACVFEVSTSKVMAQVGPQAANEMARRGTTLLASSDAARRLLSIAGASDEVIVMGGGIGLAVRRLSARPDLAVHVVFTPSQSDWPALRPQVMALDATLR